MRVGIALESGATAEHLLPAMRQMNKAIKSFFERREYGPDIARIVIGVILMTEKEATRFHRVRPFESHKLERTQHPGTGEIMEFRNAAGWDVMPDLEALVGVEPDAAITRICESLAESTAVLDAHHAEFRNFAVDDFREDFRHCLASYLRGN